MVAVGLNTSNHLTGIVGWIARYRRVAAPAILTSCFLLSFVLLMSYLCLNSVLFTSYIRRDVSRGALFNSGFYRRIQAFNAKCLGAMVLKMLS